MKKIIFLLTFYILFVFCASLTTQVEKVMVTSKPERIAGCEFMGQVESSLMLVNLKAVGVVYNYARNELMNEATQLGANVVLTPANYSTLGDAYNCKSATL